MRKWKRNWILKRMVLGFAVAALVVPAAAQAGVDSGLGYQPNSNSEVSKGNIGGPRMQVTGTSESNGGYVPFVTDFPKYEATSSVKVGTPSGLPNAGLNDYLKARDGIEIVRLQPRDNRTDDVIENVRLAPRSVSTPQVVSSPGFDWSDAGIGAGLALALVLAGGAAFIATRHMGRTQTA
jgi:hypothetical protein